jgi:hypothetical protein
MAYGLGASLSSAGLAGQGAQQQREATAMLGAAADQEQQRKLKNEQIEAERKQGNQQLGSTVGAAAGMAIGAEYGSVGGPWGAVIGGVLGALGSRLF